VKGTAAEVLDFWFGPAPLVKRAEWFRKDPAFDDRIRQRFGPVVDEALAQGLHWGGEPPARLAQLIVLDQFPRNLYRGSARAFAGDPQALALALALVDSGDHLALHPLQRWFAYLPLEHAEDLAHQDLCVALCAALADAEPGFAEALDYARRHRDVIARYGRFPHRNAALGRQSTPDELTYLATPGSGF
jgi:uncharacterized protein (DUF924 family)